MPRALVRSRSLRRLGRIETSQVRAVAPAWGRLRGAARIAGSGPSPARVGRFRAVPSLFGDRERFSAGLTEVGPGVHAWLQPNGAWGETNTGLVVGNRESLLVDTLWDLPC